MTDSQRPRTNPPRRFWPARPADLVDTTLCPSCFRSLRGPVCEFCGLDMRTPLSPRLLEFGREILRTEAERQATIDEMRTAAAARAVRSAASPSPAHAPNDVGSQPRAAAPIPAPAPAGAPPAPFTPPEEPSGFAPVVNWAAAPPALVEPNHGDPAAPFAASDGGLPPVGPSAQSPVSSSEPPKPRRSTAQALILTTGVVLFSVFAIFFAVLAYVVASIELRSILTAAASVIVLGIAWALRSRRLAGTAEGIAVIGVVLLLLDVWIIRTNRLFDADRLDVWLYTGLAFFVLAAVLVGTTRLTGLRAPSLSASLVASIGVFSLIVGATAPIAADGTRALLGAVAAMLVLGLEFIETVPRAERVILRSTALLAGTTAVVIATFAFPSLTAGPVLGFGIAVIGWSAVTAMFHRSTSVLRGAAWQVLGGIGLAVATGGLAMSAAHSLSSTAEAESGWRPVLLTAAVAVLATISRASAGSVQRTVRLVAILVASFAAFAILVPMSTIGASLAVALSEPWFRQGPLDAIVGDGTALAGSSIGLSVTALLAAATIVIARIGVRTPYVSWVPVVVAASAVTGAALVAPSGATSIAILVAAAAAGLILSLWVGVGAVVRTTSIATSIGFLLIGSWLATASSGLWPGSTLLVLLLLVTARALIARGRIPAPSTMSVVTSTSTTLVLLGAGGLAPTWAESIGILDLEAPDGSGVAIVGALILVALGMVIARTARIEAIIVGSLATLSTIGATATVWVLGTGSVDAWWRIAVTLSILTAAMAWSPRARPLGTRVAAAAVAIPTATLFGAELTRVLGASLDPRAHEGLGTLVASSVLVIAAAVSAIRSIRRRPRVPAVALALDIALALTALVVLVITAIEGAAIGPLVLLVLALTPTLIAFRPVEGRYPRRQLGWAGASLAVAALWWFLTDQSVGPIEYYSLPVAGLLLLIGASAAVAHARSANRAATIPRRLLGTEAVISSAAAVAVIPSSLLAAEGTPVRALVVNVLGAALLVLALAVIRDTPSLRGRGIAWFTALVALAIPLMGRAIDGRPAFGVDPSPDIVWWLAVVVAVLLASGFLVSRVRTSSVLAGSALVTSSVMILVGITALIFSGVIDGVEATAWLVVLCTAAVLASGAADRVMAGAAIVTAIAAVILGAVMLASVPHVEYVSVPLGVGAIAAGALRMRRNPSIRSWPALAPGLLVLILPSLSRDFGSTELWRVIAVGIVAIVVLLVGVLARLQSPLVIGAVTAMVHGLAQLWPWISGLYEAGYWWLWAGIGGVVLIVFAARYEQRMKNIRDARRAISALR